MTVEEALKHLGATRVIWIDDHFNFTPDRLGAMIVENLEAALLCKFKELEGVLERFEFAEDAVRQEVVQILVKTTAERRDEIRSALLASESAVEGAQVSEMPVPAIDAACKLLAVAPRDQWTFEKVEEKVKAAIQKYGGRDDEVSYIVDIHDGMSPDAGNRRGVDVLRVLANEGSKGTAFVLTHETVTAKEATYEQDLVRELDGSGIAPFPFCVVSKQRLLPAEGDRGAMEEAFRVAIKRAGLRRSVHEVLRLAEPAIAESLVKAKRNLLRIPPEVLDRHVVKRSQEEGESELHVIERALTAFIARDVRHLFGSNEGIRTSVERVRSLRDIELRSGSEGPDADLIDFRNAETWESASLINSAFSPLACGDVFEIDMAEPRIGRGGNARRFVLLVQPCDVQLRQHRDRNARSAILAPLKPKENKEGQPALEERLKQIDLPCTLDGQIFVCDLRKATAADLTILDLATFRPDGCVRYDKGQTRPTALLPGQDRIYDTRTDWLNRLVAEFEASQPAEVNGRASAEAGPAETEGLPPSPEAAVKMEANAHEVGVVEARRKGDESADLQARATISRRLQLAFASTDEFKHVEVGTPEAPFKRRENRKDTSLPFRVTWCLRRIGRIRMPYAADLLDRYVAVISRNAFDVDFAAPGSLDATPAPTPTAAKSRVARPVPSEPVGPRTETGTA